MRLQLAWSILLSGYAGVRPGEFIESSRYRGTNQGLKYGDVELFRIEKEGVPLIHLKITFKLRKNQRRDESKYISLSFYEEPTQRDVCPVTNFLAFAIADGAIDQTDVLNEKRIAPGMKSERIHVKEAVAEVPILRAIENQCKISSTRILKYSSLNHFLGQLGKRAGYEDNLTSYCFRRGAGNQFDENVTSAQRQQLMGHANEAVFQYYISRTFGGDLQSIILGREQQKDTMNLLRSMELTRDRRAPGEPSSELIKSGVRVVGKAASRQEYELQRARKKKEMVHIRQQFFKQSPRSPSPDPQKAMDVDETKHYVRPRPSRCLAALLKYDHSRDAVVQNFYRRESQGPLPLREALKPLVEIAKPGAWFACYPRANAEDDECPVCMTKFRPKEVEL
ncbi:hypothetical protein BFW01_g9717 [Lasiodiplodia theobromae]|nr:hypothetical protein BFW01_g9717 [Lasiodiplodia theobromae]